MLTSEGVLVLVATPDRTGTAPLAISSTLQLLVHGAINRPLDCHVCGSPRTADARFCEACGAASMVIVDDLPIDGVPAERHAALRLAVSEQFTLVGEVPRVDDATIYFARETQADGPLLALVPRTHDATSSITRCVLDVMPAIDAIQPSLPDLPTAAVNVGVPIPIQTDDPLVGELLDGKYRILRLLGQGGMGRVFDARHEQLRARRAIKVMHQHLQSRGDLVTRFYEEARNAERVKHEHVCSVHDFGESNGVIYIAMEFIDGEPVSTVVKREGRLAPDRVGAIVAQTAAALDAAHALKIIHRDVKPDNIMLCRRADGSDDVKVVDFGISKALNRAELTRGGEDTKFGVVIGTVDYMSDEQRNGREVDNRTDVYALGRTALKMLYGTLPDHGAWSEWSRSNVHPALAQVLGRAFAPREQRYASAGEFARALVGVLHDASPDRHSWWKMLLRLPTQSVDALRRRPRLAAGIAIGVAATLVAALIVVNWAVRPTPTSIVEHRIAIKASPTSLSFELDSGGPTPNAQTVRIATVGGERFGALPVARIQYDRGTANWLATPTLRAGDDSASATLVLEPRVDSLLPGAYSANLTVVSPADSRTMASVVASLVVRPAPVAIQPIRPTANCAAAQPRLAEIRTLTDPLTGTKADARRVVSLVPALVTALCTTGDKVEAQLRLAEAHMTLSQPDRACAVLHDIEQQAKSTSFATNVRVYLSRCK